MSTAPPPETNRPLAPLESAAPAPPRMSWVAKSLALAGALLSALYLSNIGVGIFELIPDNLPLAGNIDEFLVTIVLLYCLRRLGIDLVPHLLTRGKK